MKIITCVQPNAYVYCDADVNDPETNDYLVVGLIYFEPFSMKIKCPDAKYKTICKAIEKKFNKLKPYYRVTISATGQTAQIKY